MAQTTPPITDPELVGLYATLCKLTKNQLRVIMILIQVLIEEK